MRLTSKDFWNSNFDSFKGNLNTLGVEEVNLTDVKTQISPNPSSDFLTVSGLKTTENYSIYTATGYKIADGLIDDNQQIAIKFLSNGLYFLKFENNKTIKFIKN